MENKLIVYNLIHVLILASFYFQKIQVNQYLKCFLMALFSYLYVLFFGFFKEYLINASYLFLVLYFVIIVIELFSNHDSLQKKIMYAIIPHIIISASILISVYVISLSKYWVINIPKVLETECLLCMISSNILEIVTLVIINKCEKYQYRKTREWLITGILITTDIFLMVATNITFGNKLSTIDLVMMVVSIVLFIIFLFYMLFFDDTKDTFEELHSLKHDLRHAVSMIKVNEIEKEIKEAFVPIYSGNTMIDSILNPKLKELVDHGIEYKCYVNITEEIKINEEDFSMLLINLLDNCIEHCDGYEKNVSIEIFNKNKNLVLKISNTINEENNAKEKIYREGHGFGLKSVKNTVDKYHGIIKLTKENHNFCCGIVFFENEY